MNKIILYLQFILFISIIFIFTLSGTVLSADPKLISKIQFWR